jgi:predicted HTH transcriptional regulator
LLYIIGQNACFSLEKSLKGEPLEKDIYDTVNDTVNLIKINPKITLDELALKLNKSRRTITRNIKKLQNNGIIFRIGSDKTGFWQVNDFNE